MNARIISAIGLAVALASCDATTLPGSSSSEAAANSSVASVSSAAPSSSSSQVPVSSVASSSVISSVSSASSSSASPTSASLTIQEGESAVCLASGVTENEHEGSVGGYFNGENASGFGITYGITSAENGNAILQIRYANGSDAARTAQVVVNGGAGGTTDISFTQTAAWTDWQTLSVNIFLNAGENTIGVISTDAKGLANLDSSTFSGAGLSKTDCAGTVVASSSAANVSSSGSTSSAPVVLPPAGAKADPSMGGFANTAGYGLSTTTGGSGGQTVTVSNYADLERYALSNDVLIIEVQGTIKAPSDVKMMDVASNKTIIGVGSNATIDGFGFDINGWRSEQVAAFGKSCDAGQENLFTPVSNVIIRNLTFVNTTDDSVNIQCWSHHVWIDHNTFNTSPDGSVDFKRGSDLITVSYNHFINTDKTMLLGHTSDNGAQDTGKLRGTYHHNWMDSTSNRTPRVRFGYAHLYNNYMDVNNSITRVEDGGQFYGEANFIRSQSKFTQEATITGGHITLTDTNYLDLSNSTFAKNVAEGGDAYSVDNLAPPPPYKDSIDPAPMSPPSAGAGKL